ncbi:hypothetical protein OG799_04755 [Micromonospora sp. NBC_00898]|uniref:hypothetical protein n=1 Tax=Micromonospora sp. NBC_00898 TaxID=2975981 RepID=UPI00386457B1|nr:hypothetical protein OG799_04755 [Micromonospora sp. NBC_00898]
MSPTEKRKHHEEDDVRRWRRRRVRRQPRRRRAGLGLLRDAAQQKIDYPTLADPVDSPIFADLPAGWYLSLGQVVKVHHTNPELFAWCR